MTPRPSRCPRQFCKSSVHPSRPARSPSARQKRSLSARKLPCFRRRRGIAYAILRSLALHRCGRSRDEGALPDTTILTVAGASPSGLLARLRRTVSQPSIDQLVPISVGTAIDRLNRATRRGIYALTEQIGKSTFRLEIRLSNGRRVPCAKSTGYRTGRFAPELSQKIALLDLTFRNERLATRHRPKNTLN